MEVENEGRLRLRPNITLEDPEYAGKKTSRRDAFQDVSEDSDFDSDDGGKMLEDSDDEGRKMSVDDEQEDSDGAQILDEDFDAVDREYEELQKEEEDILQLLKGQNEGDLHKGQAVSNQKKLWDKALEIRIMLQSLVTGANSLPQENERDRLENDKLKSSTLQALTTLMDLEDALVQRIRTIPKDEADETEGKTTQITSSESAWERLDQSYSRFVEYRDHSVDKWYRKSQISSGAAASRGKLKAFNQSISQQVANAMKDPSRLVARMITKSSNESGDAPKNTEDEHMEDADATCFDDSGFYQMLLREFLESSDLKALGVMNQEMRKLRNKKRKVVDRRASKGRKVRYTVHEPLVNFMAPEPMSLPPMTTELFSGLFGMRSQTATA